MSMDLSRVRRLPVHPRKAGVKTVQTDEARRLPVLRGSGPWTYLCGKCGVPLAEGMVNEHLGVALECPECGAWNDARP